MSPFESFWAAYPRRVAKLDAMKAFEKALKIASAEDIIAGAKRYASVPREPQFTKYPAGWLRAGMWMDETAPARPTNGVAAQREKLRQEIENEREQGQAGQGAGPIGWLQLTDRQGTNRPH